MEMTDDRLLDLRKLCAHCCFAPEIRQRRRVVAKQEDALFGSQCGEGATNVGQMLCAQLPPSGELFGERFRLEDRQRHERGNDTHQNVTANLHLPEGLQPKLALRPVKTRQPHATVAADETALSNFMVAEVRAKSWAEAVAEFCQAFLRALARGLVADADEPGVAGVIAVGDHVIHRTNLI